jgi:hypothetical protein
MVDTGSSLTARRTKLGTIPYKTKTGVQIGLRYNESPKPMPIDDSDMELIQGFLICSGRPYRQRRAEKLTVLLSSIVLVFVMIALMVTGK